MTARHTTTSSIVPTVGIVPSFVHPKNKTGHGGGECQTRVRPHRILSAMLQRCAAQCRFCDRRGSSADIQHHASTCLPLLRYFIEKTHQTASHTCPGTTPCDATHCRWVETVVYLHGCDEAVLTPALDGWLRSAQRQPEFPNHAPFYALLSNAHGVDGDGPFGRFVLQRWLASYTTTTDGDNAPPLQHIQFVYTTVGSHPLLRTALLGAIVRFLRCPTPDELNEWEQFDVAQLLDTVCVPEHQATLSRQLGHHLESPRTDPLRLQFVALLWGLQSVRKDHAFDIRPCLDALIRHTQAHPRIRERLIRITWSQCPPHDIEDTVLIRLLAAWSVQPDRSLPLLIMLEWDTAITFVLSAMHHRTAPDDPIAHDPVRCLLAGNAASPLRNVNQASFLYAFAAAAPHSIMQRIANEFRFEVALPPRLAALCPLDGIGMDLCVSRLATPYRACLKSAHRMLARDAQIGWWVSWIGYVILAVRCAEAGGVSVPPLSVLPTTTIVL